MSKDRKKFIDLTKVTEKTSLLKLFKKKNRPKNLFKKSFQSSLKPRNGFQKMIDINPPELQKFSYIKGQKVQHLKKIDNLIRLGLIGFFLIFILNSLSSYFTAKRIETEVSSFAESGIYNLLDAGKATLESRLDSARLTFQKATENFEKASQEVWFLKYQSGNSSITATVESLLAAGEHVSLAGNYFIEALTELTAITGYFLSTDFEQESTDLLTSPLKSGLKKIDLAIEQIDLATQKINQISDRNVPSKLKARIDFAKEQINQINESLQSISSHFPALLKLLGDEHPHRYLVLLQNDNEIRPAGGFIGSYAIVDVRDSKIINLSINDVYQLDNFYTEIIEPPEEFRPFTSNWRLRDSNFSHSFPLSAAKARWFLEKQGGPTVDTVIAINESLLKDLLKVTGPIQVGSFGTLNSENYNLLLTYVIESKLWGAEDPKHILKVFVQSFKEKALEKENLTALGRVLFEAINQKNIMMYSSDPEIQSFFELVSVSGTAHHSAENEDYLSVVHISTGGTKTEPFIDEKITHDTKINQYGEITNHLTILRRHTWNDSYYNIWKRLLTGYGITEINEQVFDIMGRGRNRVSTRIYVPEGSVLVDDPNNSEVIEKYDKDLQKSYYFITSELDPGEQVEIAVSYKLPFTLKPDPAAIYRLYVDKQPGNQGSIFTKTFSSNFQIVQAFPADINIDSGYAKMATNLLYDRDFGLIIKD